ncbi:3-deoxy-8-phosphooctulonate synthase [bacterium]|nr:3-deoxy-8-phosphooctulonate synthase [bacterium]
MYNKLKQSENFFLLAGPCVIESEAIMYRTAEELKRITEKFDIPFIFKASYKKANRTSLDSYTGVGLEEGLKILAKIKHDFQVAIVTDIHETWEVKSVAEVADIIQIPAFLSRQTDLLVESGKSGRIVNIKKAQFMAGEDIITASEKVASTGNDKILLTERGTSFGYHNLVVDFRNFAIMSGAGYPVVYDVTHSLQQPSIGKISGGNPEYVPMMAKAALASGYVDGLFIETHPEPLSGLSDAKSMFQLSKMEQLITECVRLWNAR